MIKNIITTREASKILGVNKSRVIQLILAGRLKATKLGNMYVMKEKDLEKVKNRKPGRPKKNVKRKIVSAARDKQ